MKERLRLPTSQASQFRRSASSLKSYIYNAENKNMLYNIINFMLKNINRRNVIVPGG